MERFFDFHSTFAQNKSLDINLDLVRFIADVIDLRLNEFIVDVGVYCIIILVMYPNHWHVAFVPLTVPFKWRRMSGVACIIQWTFQWHRTFMVLMYYFSIQIYTIHLSSHFNPIKTFNCYISIHEFCEIVAALFTSIKLKMGSMFFLNIQVRRKTRWLSWFGSFLEISFFFFLQMHNRNKIFSEQKHL